MKYVIGLLELHHLPIYPITCAASPQGGVVRLLIGHFRHMSTYSNLAQSFDNIKKMSWDLPIKINLNVSALLSIKCDLLV